MEMKEVFSFWIYTFKIEPTRLNNECLASGYICLKLSQPDLTMSGI